MQMPQVTTIYRLCSIKGGGWSWHKSDGDNFEHTEKILGKWYRYRMHF